MNLASYSDDELIEELKHRGIKIELDSGDCFCGNTCPASKVKIGGVVFDLRT